MGTDVDKGLGWGNGDEYKPLRSQKQHCITGSNEKVCASSKTFGGTHDPNLGGTHDPKLGGTHDPAPHSVVGNPALQCPSNWVMMLALFL